MSDTVQVEGQRELGRALDGVDAGLADMTATNDAVARVVVPAARRRAPRRTGRLASSIHGTGQPGEARIGTAVSYGWPVHSGVPAHHQRAQPFITQAIQDTQAQITATYGRDVNKLVESQVSAKAMH